MKKREMEIELNTKLKGVMDFYVSTYFEYYGNEIKKEVVKQNAFIEVDIMERQIDDLIGSLSEEAAKKFHDVCSLLLDTVVAGREPKVREFEVLFIDLVRRTLIADMQEASRELPQPIVIIADPNVEAKEN